MWDLNQPDPSPDNGRGEGSTARTVDNHDSKHQKAVVAKESKLTIPAKRAGSLAEKDLNPLSRRLKTDRYPTNPCDEDEFRHPASSTSVGSGSSSGTSLSLVSSHLQGIRVEIKFPLSDAGIARTGVEAEDDMSRLSKQSKGKGKMKIVPELPVEVWRRIFELYYDERAQGESFLPSEHTLIVTWRGLLWVESPWATKIPALVLLGTGIQSDFSCFPLIHFHLL